MPFASTEGFKDGLFLGEFTTLPAVDSPANFLIGRNPGVVEFKRVTKVRILLAPPCSLNCRGFPFDLRRNTRTMPVFRDYSQTNRTAENGLLSSEGGHLLAFLQRAHAQSGFDKGSGECNAIASWDLQSVRYGRRWFDR